MPPYPAHCAEAQTLVVGSHKRPVPIAREVGFKAASVAVEQHGERDPRHAPRPACHAPADVVLATPSPHGPLALAGIFRSRAQRHALTLVIGDENLRAHRAAPVTAGWR